MLAQNFLDSTALGISEVERNALIKVLGALEREEIPDLDRRAAHTFVPLLRRQKLKFFYMPLSRVNTDCGTAGCIRGHAEWLTNDDTMFEGVVQRDRGDPLHDLFYPSQGIDAKAHQAASALRNFLTLGEPRWGEALKTTLPAIG